jgi:hypothetical protein
MRVRKTQAKQNNVVGPKISSFFFPDRVTVIVGKKIIILIAGDRNVLYYSQSVH